MSRLDEILSVIKPVSVLADIGCDHGYISKKALDNNLCKKLVFTDISEKCLLKAKTLLKTEVDKRLAVPVLANGLTGVDIFIDEAVIAGMGGEEIIQILKECLTRTGIKTLVLQPMKNTDKLRRFLVENGFYLERDYVFKDAGKFYDLIVASLSDTPDFYTDLEYEFGRENLQNKSKAFKEKYLKEIESINLWLQSPTIKEDSVLDFKAKIEKYQKVIFDHEN
ncbi:MAG: SAM-dependent methyltransferase [Clostridia bacterium]|nr:SAM-dependent methyltransferase [Clostridia bacterium]